MPATATRIAAWRKWVTTERVAHACVALVLAAIIAASTILRPLDMGIWSFQARLFDKPASGEIGLLNIDYKLIDGKAVIDNSELADALARLRESDVSEIYLDVPLYRSSSPEIDQSLRKELRALGERVTLSQTIVPQTKSQSLNITSDAFFSEGMKVVSNDIFIDFLGFSWEAGPFQKRQDEAYTSLAHSLAENVGSSQIIYIDYGTSIETIPAARLQTYLSGQANDFTTAAPAKVVVGLAASDVAQVKLADGSGGYVSPSVIHILAAETALYGGGRPLFWYSLLLPFAIALLIIVVVPKTARLRRIGYASWVTAILVVLVVLAATGTRSLLTIPISAGVFYAVLRGTIHYKKRHLLIEPRSGLPNFVALQRDLRDADDLDERTVVVAKIARLEAVSALLSARDQGEYLRLIAARLTLGAREMRVYFDGAKHLAFCVKTDNYPHLQSHLEGLRAVSSQSVTVSGQPYDVSLTLGADDSPGLSIAKKLSQAIAAAERAREAYDPVHISGHEPERSSQWDYSLQARLEEALTNDDISIKLQPQIDLASGQIVGAEALVRWTDSSRGEIPAAQFIAQCESVGRLDDLTQRVMAKSFEAAILCERNGFSPSISINVSSIQLVDRRIVAMIHRELERSSVDPAKITIEITETARIDDLAMARRVCEEIRALGMAVSIDDFGVGSANLEVLSELPFSELKLDRIFVQKMASCPKARAIIVSMVHLAKDMSLICVAEGVEDKATYASLKEIGCDRAQGYLMAKPMPVRAFLELVRKQRSSADVDRFYG
ncbi:EAL domain-containing protein [Altererythrobacter aurantiacus]|uniref:EAL domain-containing protein n=1 Tax=Parapontixanthobacter aurantiacus TaxID=1463599 RepID=A0A844ZJL6_9SPHN|nr:EAL domain-containing protein [Parapontixanthobacter aurantiacus]MXO87097.1 EAL domain-containing protein [Parapontixanthobacter aurantiacus]